MFSKGTETTPRPMAFLTVIARKYKGRIFALIIIFLKFYRIYFCRVICMLLRNRFVKIYVKPLKKTIE